MKKKEKLAYSKLLEGARFREQFRLAFAGVIVATFFVVPDLDVLANFLKLFLGISALLSAIYLIVSAARVKYKEPGHVYQALYVTERFRMRMFDWSVDVFGFAFLCFISLFAIGGLQEIFNIRFDEFWTWIIVIGLIAIEMIIAWTVGYIAKSRELKTKLPEI